MKLTDWLGNEYGVGDHIIYAAGSGRSITMIFGQVTDIYCVFRDPGEWSKWVRLEDGAEPPFELKWNHERKGYFQTEERVETVTRVQVQPLNSSRWKQHHSKTRYIDTRTGRGIDPFVIDRKTGLYRHLTGGYFENVETGEKVHHDAYYSHTDLWHYRYWDPASLPEPWRYVKDEFKPYVQKVEEGPKPVTLNVIENIVKWTGQIHGASL